MREFLNHYRECELQLANIRASSIGKIRDTAEKLLAPVMQITEAILADEDLDREVLQNTLIDIRERIKNLESGDYHKALHPEIPPPDSGVRDTDPAPISDAPDTLEDYEKEDSWFI